MCDPISIATFAISAASSIAQYSEQMAQSKAVEKNAQQTFRNDIDQLSLRQIQEANATAQKDKQTTLEVAEKSAEVEASAAAAGVSGISVDNLVADVQRRGARNKVTQYENLKMTVQQIQQEKKGVRATAQSRINSAPRPSALGLVAGIGGAALEGYNAHTKYMAGATA